MINDKKAVKLRCGLIKFKNHFKQLTVPFKIYVDFESLLKGVRNSNKNNSTSYAEKYQDHIPCSFVYKVVCINDRFSKPVVLYRRKHAFYRFIEAVLEEYRYCKKAIRKNFNKNLVMFAEDEERFQSSNKMFDAGDNKVGNHCHLTGKYTGSAHLSCNINIRLTKNVSVIFHKLKGYESHLIMQEIGKFNVEVSVIPNVLEKYMAITIS